MHRNDVLLQSLPEGLHVRPLRFDEAQTLYELHQIREAHDWGQHMYDLSDIICAWSQPEFDLETMFIGVFDGEEFIAGSEVFRGRAEGMVHPKWRNRGIGTALVRWMEHTASDFGRNNVGTTIHNNDHGAKKILTARGFTPAWTSWILELPLSSPLPVTLPDGYSFVEYNDERAREVFEVVDVAFSDWPGRESYGFDNWNADVMEREERTSYHTLLIEHKGELVGVAIGFDYAMDKNEGWIAQLAVAKEHRYQGLGKALLAESCTRFYHRGAKKCGLSTDSRTGVLNLYEQVGMNVTHTFTRYAKEW